MTDDECQMTKEIRMTNGLKWNLTERIWVSNFVILSSFGIRHPSFQIVLLRILLHHPSRGELRHERYHGMANTLNPLARDALRIAVEELRNDFVGEDLI